jgi:maltooligosyltrehalose trehalohydrolase
VRVGCAYLGEGKCLFRVWAPYARSMEVRVFGDGPRRVGMTPTANGYWEATSDGIKPGTRYVFGLDGGVERPDPASCFQPDGVGGPSAVVDHNSFPWDDREWRGIPLGSVILYEIHVGTFTPEGTFGAVAPRLAEIRGLGINALELMPIAQFPGSRNWGYDGSFPYAVQNSYGGPEGLKHLVNEAHKLGMAVFLDVVYNHIGPEGNRLEDLGPYYSTRYNGLWGRALNFDEAGSDPVRDYFIENALYWFREFHVDGLRLDAADAIFDQSARTFLEELAFRTAALAKETGRNLIITAESDRNDPRIMRPPDMGGYGIDAQWCDDFHHILHVLLTGERRGYYADFEGLDQMVRSMKQGYVYQGEYSGFRGRRHGAPPTGCRPEQFIVFSQNHDQVGNRLGGRRLSGLVSFEGAKLAAACVLISPFVPMLFMGEEYGETSPFLFFVDHSSKGLLDGVRRGRKKTMEAFGWTETPEDPTDMGTFEKSRIVWERRVSGRHAVMLSYYREVLKLRSELPALARSGGLTRVGRLTDAPIIYLQRAQDGNEVFAVVNFAQACVRTRLPLDRGVWRRRLDSSDVRWEGPGSSLPETVEGSTTISLNPQSAAVFEKVTGEGA